MKMRVATLFGFLVVLVTSNGCSSSGGGGTGGTSGTGIGGATGGGGAAAGGSGGPGGGGAAGRGGTTGAGGATACGTTTAARTGTTCNTLNATGPCVMPAVATGAAPVAGGGSIQPGTYELQSRTGYDVPDAATASLQPLRQTLVIGAGVGGTFPVDIVTASGTRINRQHGAAVVSGMQVAFTPSCPPPADGGSNDTVLGYTATATTFTTMQTTNTGVVVVDVYTLP